MEANPESVTPDLLEAAKTSGINRISIGVQSLSDIELEKVGRIHSASQAIQAIEQAKNAGFENISADVILGLARTGLAISDGHSGNPDRHWISSTFLCIVFRLNRILRWL